MNKKRILITGATSGIGEATFKHAIRNGHSVFITGRNEAKLKELTENNPGTFYMKVDVTSVSDVQNLLSSVLEKMGGIDVLMNNAGIGIFDKLIDSNLDDWHQMIDVNIKGVLNVLHYFLPHLIESNGQVINLGSVASHHVFPESGVYCATKHAVLAISESLRAELSKKIRVTTISPGSVNTPFISQTKNEELLNKFKPSFENGMTPEWVASQIMNTIEVEDGMNISEIIVRPFQIKK
jgi:NADP-dependent 3-hydroxy acid dehydrogenase YdfG